MKLVKVLSLQVLFFFLYCKIGTCHSAMATWQLSNSLQTGNGMRDHCPSKELSDSADKDLQLNFTKETPLKMPGSKSEVMLSVGALVPVYSTCLNYQNNGPWELKTNRPKHISLQAFQFWKEWVNYLLRAVHTPFLSSVSLQGSRQPGNIQLSG